MADKRLFVGLPLSEDYKKTMAELQRRHKAGLKSRMTWTRPENWHLTLKFIGEVPEERLGEIKKALRQVRFSPFSFRAGGGGFFPPIAGARPRPRVMWIGCSKGRNECATLSADIDERLAALGFERERRSFSPHLTMARIKRAENDPWREIMDKLAEIQWPELTMDRFILWQSELSPQGPKYTALEEFGAGE